MATKAAQRCGHLGRSTRRDLSKKGSVMKLSGNVKWIQRVARRRKKSMCSTESLVDNGDGGLDVNYNRDERHSLWRFVFRL